MRLHGNAKLTPFQRGLLCVRVRDDGWTVEEAADAAGCSERTAYRWLARRGAGEPMTDRSSAPLRCPTRTPAAVEAEIERLRRLRWTSTRIAAVLELATSTVCRGADPTRVEPALETGPPEPPNRYCRRHAGELVPVDVKKLGRFLRPGHRVLGRVRARLYRPRRMGSRACLCRRRHPTRLRRGPCRRTRGDHDRVLRTRGCLVRPTRRARPTSHERQRRALRLRALGDMVFNSSRRTHPHPRLPAPHQRKAERLSRQCCGSGPTPRRIAPPSIELVHCLPAWIDYYNHQRPHGPRTQDTRQPAPRRLTNVPGNNS